MNDNHLQLERPTATTTRPPVAGALNAPIACPRELSVRAGVSTDLTPAERAQHTGNSQGEATDRPLISSAAPTDDALDRAHERQTKLNQFAEALKRFRNPKRAAREVGVPLLSLRRWEERFAKEGFTGLVDRCRNSGRESVAEKLRRLCGATAWELCLQVVRALALDLDGSAGAAWRKFARCGGKIEQPFGGSKIVVKVTHLDAPQAVKDYFTKVGEGRRSKHSISKSLLKLVKPSPILNNAHRGRRTLSLKGAYTPRKLDILPGDIFSSDDTTPIWAWWVPWPKSEEYPFGCKVLQGQFLPVIDVASQNPLAFALIAREKSSYRAADIWALFGYVFDKFGLPRLGVQFERGSWEATLIAGAKVIYQNGEVSQTRRVGGLRMLPTNITPWHLAKQPEMEGFSKTLQTWTSYLPKSKSIEAFLHRSQKLEGTLYGCLGRDQMRRPFERAKKIFEACKRNAEDARLHFFRGDELASRLRDQFEFYAGERIEGEVFWGKPGELWNNGLAEHGELLRMPEAQRYLFRRDWSVCTISRGWVKPSRTDETTGRKVSYFYQNPNLFAERDGQEVIVYFDREDFESPAQIHSLDGRHLGSADYFQRKGMFLDGEMDGHELRRLYNGAVMTIYAQIAPHCPSRQLPPEIAARRAAASISNPESQISNPFEARWQDGRGGAARIEFQRDAGSSCAPEILGSGGSSLPASRPLSTRGAAPAGSTDDSRRPQAPASLAVPRATFDRNAAAEHIARREAEARERGELLET